MRKRALLMWVLGLGVPGWCVSSGPADGLVGYWRFDEASGTLAGDSSGHGSMGTLRNMPPNSAWVAGQVGGALHFRGPFTRGYVEIPSYVRPTTTMTLSAWVWADSVPQWAAIASCYESVAGPFYFGTLGSDALISAYSADSSGLNVANVYADTELTLGAWHFVAFRTDGDRIELWQDDGLVGFSPGNSTILASSLPLQIGGNTHFDYPFQGFWDGKIDEVALWNRALDDWEFAAIYSKGLAGEGILPVPEPSALLIGLGWLAVIGWCRSERRIWNTGRTLFVRPVGRRQFCDTAD